MVEPTSLANPAPRAPRRPRGPALSAQRIAEAAMALIDAEGLEAFSFRTLAAGLGCQAMSIYHYFPSKAHLYETLVEAMLTEAMDFPSAGPWSDRLHAAAAAYRRMALGHPGMFYYFSSFRLNNKAGLMYLERILAILEDAGLNPRDRAKHFHILGHYLVGACLDEVVKGPGSTRPMPFAEAREAYPGLMTVAPYFASDRQKDTFEAGITLLIAGIKSDLSL